MSKPNYDPEFRYETQYEPAYKFLEWPDTPPVVADYLRRDEYPNEADVEKVYPQDFNN